MSEDKGIGHSRLEPIWDKVVKPKIITDEKGPVIEVGTIKEILLIEIKRTLNEFWREYATLNNEISPEKKLMILNEHIKNLTLWLNLDRR